MCLQTPPLAVEIEDICEVVLDTPTAALDAAGGAVDCVRLAPTQVAAEWEEFVDEESPVVRAGPPPSRFYHYSCPAGRPRCY